MSIIGCIGKVINIVYHKFILYVCSMYTNIKLGRYLHNNFNSLQFGNTFNCSFTKSDNILLSPNYVNIFINTKYLVCLSFVNILRRYTFIDKC